MKKTLLLSLITFFFIQSFAQKEDSLLKNFKFRIEHYRAINLNLNTAGQYNQAVLGLGDQKQSSSSSSFFGTYYSTKSTDNILFTATANLGTNLNFSKSDYTNTVSKSNSFTANPGIAVLNKWFSNKMFTELGANISSSLSSSKQTETTNPLSYRSTNTDYDFSINLGIGTGRLENVTDMQNALWLYKELMSANILSRELSADEKTSLGRSITQGNNTRVLDTRRKTKFILSTVDNYLQQKNLIDKTDINYFSSLNDILFFAVNYPRLSGTEKFIRLKPQIEKWLYTDTDKNIDTKHEQLSNKKSVFLSAGIKKYKPVDLVHQNNYGIALNLSYHDMDATNRTIVAGNSTDNLKGSSIAKQASVNLFFEHAIYPNTRTVLNFKVETETGYQNFNKERNFFGVAYLDGTYNYFISYQTRLICNIGVAYQKNMYQFDRYTSLYPNNLRLYGRLGINISI